ncbi:MAG: beta-lactamase family protein [Chloroflexi bacterium]|nr:beta-lactamase family protein [Chloroflexota bacterium]
MLASPVAADQLDSVFSLVREGVASGDFPSAVFAVADRHAVIRCEAFGPADGSSTVTPDSIYLLASITKPMVATAMMRLVERGTILLHEPVAGFWPAFAANGKEQVALWHLLTHTSGLDEKPQPLPDLAQAAALTTADLHAEQAARAAASGLNFAPGTRFTYCNASFRVMAELIQRLTGRSYLDYLRAEVLEPLGMADTTFSPSPDQQQRVLPVVGFPSPAHFDLFIRSASPAGGIFSTAADLIAFGRAFLHGGTYRGYRLLAPATVAKMTRVHFRDRAEFTPGQPEAVAVGLGWFFDADRELLPDAAFRHAGASGTRLVVDPANDLVAVFLTNRWGMDTRRRDRIFNALYGAL